MSGDGNRARMLTAEERDARIDAALRAVGTARPSAGLEGRILNRLAAERVNRGSAPAGLLHRMPRFVGAAVTAVFVCVAGAAIVMGSVEHSRGLHHAPVVAPPVPGLPGNGIGAASAEHPAAPVSAPVLAKPNSRGRSNPADQTGDHGRARIKRHAHKAAGVAVPATDEKSPQ